MMLLLFILYSWPGLGQCAYCPPVEPPCACSSSSLEPINIRCSGASSLVDVLKALSPAKNSLKIDSLSINATPINILPPKAFQGFNIARLSIRKAGLTGIDPMLFDGPLLESMTEIDFTDNNFTEIPINGLSMLKSLRKLTLAKNQIANLQPDSFASYESKACITSLDLSFNRLAIIDPSAIAPLKNLEEVNLQGNRMVEVPMTMLRQIKWTLKHLNLALNRIVFIEPFTFDLPKLESLSLEYNEIRDLSPDSLYGLPSLLYLYLTGNKFVRWESEIFRSVRKLRNLGIGGTSITHIPWNAFTYSPHLLRLEMSHGAINTIDRRAFRATPCIQAIILNNNKLTQVNQDTFQGLANLYTLDLSQNVIQCIADRAFSFLPSLRHLDMSGNQLRTLEPQTFDNTFVASTDTKVLYLCRNPWECDEKMDIFRRWLRDNIDVIIDKPDCTALCKEPSWLTNWPIRFPNPPPPYDSEYRSPHQWPSLNPKIDNNIISSSTSTSPSFASSTTSAPFRPPYLSRISHTQSFMENTSMSPLPTTAIALPLANSLFASLQLNPANNVIDRPNDVELVDVPPTHELPTFAQVLFGKVPGSMKNVFRPVATSQPRVINEHAYLYANS